MMKFEEVCRGIVLPAGCRLITVARGTMLGIECRRGTTRLFSMSIRPSDGVGRTRARLKKKVREL